MLLNHVEYALMNNPLRAAIQRHFEARRLLRMGGALEGGTALEVGCGRGVGAQLVLDVFGASTVDAFDLDARMISAARKHLGNRGGRIRLWVGDATSIAVPDATYDAVFDFGIIHHIPDWRRALAEVARVLKPGGRFFAEEMLAPFLRNPITRQFLDHPQEDRFDAPEFAQELRECGLNPLAAEGLGRSVAWFVAVKTGCPATRPLAAGSPTGITVH